MPVVYQLDRKFRPHTLLKQTYQKSCGPTCCAMVARAYLNTADPDPEATARRISRKFWGGFDQNHGTQMFNLVNVLQEEGIKCSNAQAAGGANILLRIRAHARPKTPMIVRLKWNSGGAHFVVVHSIDTDRMVTFYDPFYGLVELPSDMLPTYKLKTGEEGSLTGDEIHTYL